MVFVLHTLSPRSLIFDIRTKLAAHKMLASGVPGAHTIAIEPIPATFERQQVNLRLDNMLVTAITSGKAVPLRVPLRCLPWQRALRRQPRHHKLRRVAAGGLQYQ